MSRVIFFQDVQETTEILKTLLEAGARPSLEHVTLAILRLSH